MTAEEFTKRAREEIADDDVIEEIRVQRESSPGATPLYFINLNCGWREKIVAGHMFKQDAIGVAYALGVVFDCPNVVTP